MVIIYHPNVPGSNIVSRKLAKNSVHVKNSTKGLDKVPSTAAKKKFAAKLRKVRWRIYRDIDLKKGNVIKSLKYYKRQVRLFLKCFSKKLKPEEPSIWKEKVYKTSDDVHAFKRNKKKKESCVNCSCMKASSIDAALLMLSAAYNFVKANRASLNKVKRDTAEYLDVEIDDDESGDDIVATDEHEVGVSIPRLWWFERKETPVNDVAENIAEKEAPDKDKGSAKTEIAVGPSKPTVFKPVDWTKCIK